MANFEDLKLADDILEHIHSLGYRQPTDFQVEAVPVIGRGTTAVGIASAGCGKTLAYGLGILSRLDPRQPGLQALILRATDDRAAATAEALHRLMEPRRLRVALVQPRRDTNAQLAVASPDAALAAIEHSAIKLEQLLSFVVDGASAMLELGVDDALETVTAQLPRECQRILLTAELNSHVSDWIERHARRARRLNHLPPEVEPLGDSTLEYCAAPRHHWLPALLRLLGGRAVRSGGPIRIHCRFDTEVAELRGQLAVRDLADGETAASTIEVVASAGPEPLPGSVSISWGVPPDLSTLRSRLDGAAHAAVFAEPRELPHLRRLCVALNVRLSALKTAVPAEAGRSAQATRDQLRAAAAGRDLQPYVLLLEPLLDDFTPVEIAAAATALLRDREPEAPSKPLPAWTRLYFGVGRRDGVRPADFVGAITGEASVTGDQVGRIEIRDNHSSVEVAAPVADQVIKALSTATIRGRPANVRVYRE